MRHIPTTVYIDTSFFKSQGLRFDTPLFKNFMETFVERGLRLLVPAIMERELLRHFSREAEDIADKVNNAHNQNYVKELSLPEIPSKSELKTKLYNEMNRQWTSFKEHFVVEPLPLVGNLNDVLDWYFEILPPFSTKKNKEFPDAFIISALDEHYKLHHANIAVIGLDGDFGQACAIRNHFVLFPDLNDYIEAFKPELSGEDRLLGDVDLTKSIATEDLTELKAILARGSDVTPIEIERVMSLLSSRGTNYDYFFQNANDPIWLAHLSKLGFFQNPPDIEQTADGHFTAPWWPPIDYLVRICDRAINEVSDVISELPTINNFRILEGVFEIVLKADSADAVSRFSRFILAFIENSQWGHEQIIRLLQKSYFFSSQISDLASTILLKIVAFQPDPREEEKRSRRKENSKAWETLLEPVTRFDVWEYQEILEKGVRFLAENEPYQIARVLSDAVASMIRMSMHTEDIEKGLDEDYSEIWCRRLDEPDRDLHDAKESLVNTLTFACVQVYNKAPESVYPLDQALRNQRWKVFKRLRQHLYAIYPNDQTFPWIRELILGYPDYSRWEYHYEFQLMIHKACEHFGSRLLSEGEKATIFDAILSGPSKEDYREWMGDSYNDEAFLKRKRYFHYKQLRPFVPCLLSGENQSYFNELKNDTELKDVSDDSYSPYGEVVSGTVSYLSPKSAKDLEELTDEQLLAFLNEWDEGHRDEKDWLVEVNISALAGVVQNLFKDVIALNKERLAYWWKHRDEIARPIYVAAIVKAVQALVKEGQLQLLEQWLEFCTWVLSHSDTSRVEGHPEPNDESRKHPDWRSSRRAVVEFITICVDKNSSVPMTARDSLASLLQSACEQYDYRLDQDFPVILNRDDPVTEAINNTRSRALEALVSFGFWVRRHLPEDPLLEVSEILTERISADTAPSLTRPEFALLGMHFGRINYLIPDWASENIEALFPKSNTPLWWDIFSSYIVFNQPNKDAFQILSGEYEYGLANLNVITDVKNHSTRVIDRLSQHVFTYYLWGVFPLEGEHSFLARFFESTNKNRELWANLFGYVGHSLSNAGQHLDEVLIDRVTAFFDWRLEVGEPLELQQYTKWLEAQCLEPEWRLKSYLSILEIVSIKDLNPYREIKALNKLLQDNTPLVVECFTKITDGMDKGPRMYMPTEEAIPIIKAGLSSKNPHVLENAERAKENLLRLGHFGFLEVE